MKVAIKGGKYQVRECCKHCGKKGSQAIKQISPDWVDGLPLYDPKVNEDYHEDRIYKRDLKLLELARKAKLAS